MKDLTRKDYEKAFDDAFNDSELAQYIKEVHSLKETLEVLNTVDMLYKRGVGRKDAAYRLGIAVGYRLRKIEEGKERT